MSALPRIDYCTGCHGWVTTPNSLQLALRQPNAAPLLRRHRRFVRPPRLLRRNVVVPANALSEELFANTRPPMGLTR